MNIVFRIHRITETSFQVNYEYKYAGLNAKELRYYLSHHVIHRPEDGAVIIKMDVEITDGDDVRLAFNEIAAEYRFLSAGEVFSIQDNDSLLTRNPGIMDSLLQATVGTLRGVLMKNMKGTPLEPYPLPLISGTFFRNEGE